MIRFIFFCFFISLAHVISAQETPDFFTDSRLTTTGVYYYPEHWDSTQWDRDLKNIAAMGFEFTHFAEFAWAQIEPEEGKYDFAWLDKAVAIAAKHNLKVIMCTSTATPPVWMARKHPGILELQENGVRLDHGSRQAASFSSTWFREYSLKMVEQLAKRYGNDPRIMGWQIDNEPRSFRDYNTDAQERYRKWLKKKYGIIDNLNKAWGASFWSQVYSGFSQINIPLYSQWGINLNQKLDHYRFMAEETATFIDDQAVIIKKYALPGQWVTTNYIPNYSCGYIGKSRELDFTTYTRYMVNGYSHGIGQKGYRLGDIAGIAMANDFFRPLAPWYGVMELQPGQVNWGSINSQPLPGAVHLWLWHVFAGGSNLVCTYRYRAPLVGYEAYHYGIVGTDGVTPTQGGLEYQQFIKEINLIRSEYNNNSTKAPSDYLALKTAILFNHENIWGMDLAKQTTEWDSFGHIAKYYSTLKSFGAPVDFIGDSAVFSEYPVLLVPAYQQIDRKLLEKLTDYASAGGNLVLTCRTGHKDREMHLWEAKYAEPIYNLIGSEIEFFDLLMPYAPDSVLMDNRNYAWTSWGEVLKPAKDTRILATYKGDYYEGKPAVISRKLGKGTVTYVGVDSKNGLLEKELLKKLYTGLNLPVKHYPEGVMVEYRDGFGIGVNYSDKSYSLDIPSDAKILIGAKELPTAGVVVWKLTK
jgi:beta-galactosidase